MKNYQFISLIALCLITIVLVFWVYINLLDAMYESATSITEECRYVIGSE